MKAINKSLILVQFSRLDDFLFTADLLYRARLFSGADDPDVRTHSLFLLLGKLISLAGCATGSGAAG